VLTADNPRTEDVATIIADIVMGVPESDTHKVHRVTDRKQAIEYAYARSEQGTIIALLGKGPDEYQIIGTVKSYFSETEILQSL
jgi:UDP-N-acetylmuramoyl-L-alanyl-D-glutamate--2,6-diaminopimelate ligase